MSGCLFLLHSKHVKFKQQKQGPTPPAPDSLPLRRFHSASLGLPNGPLAPAALPGTGHPVGLPEGSLEKKELWGSQPLTPLVALYLPPFSNSATFWVWTIFSGKSSETSCLANPLERK